MKKTTKTKREIRFYKHWFAPIGIKNFLPVFNYSKNVQGWLFTRNYTFEWFTYAINFSIMVNSNDDVERMVAHELNVAKYMKQSFLQKIIAFLN